MNNVYNWTFQIDGVMVRIEYMDIMKKYIQSCIKNFSGVLMPTKLETNELIIKFKNNKDAYEFTCTILEKYPDSFSLANDWDIGKNSSSTVSFSILLDKPNSVCDLSDLVQSLFNDCKIISSLTSAEVSDINLNIDSSSIFFSFSINFANEEDSLTFLEEFKIFKA